MFFLDNILRENIKKLIPYTSAKDEFKGKAQIFLDANENAFGSPLNINYNRYPDPSQQAVKNAIGAFKGIDTPNIFLGNGSDEAIDILIRAFCDPGKDNIMILPPTYGMYSVSAAINDVALVSVLLTADFQPDFRNIQASVQKNTKLIFICSPNNPTGNDIDKQSVTKILNFFPGIVVIDEAYIDFSQQVSYTKLLSQFPNLVILQTFSKAWGMAALRLGVAFASKVIIDILNKIKPPYNINTYTQESALHALNNKHKVKEYIQLIIQERDYMTKQLHQQVCVEHVYPSSTNFLLIKVSNANEVHQYLIQKKIITRNRSSLEHCESCLRITIGTRKENQLLLRALASFEKR